MSDVTEVKIPNIGDAAEVEVIEILVKTGDRVNINDPLISLESDKATFEVPSPATGVITAIRLAIGDKVSEGDVILLLEATADTDTPDQVSTADEKHSSETGQGQEASQPQADRPPVDFETQVLVLGSGPGGYTAAFRAADLGKKTLLVERYAELGGVCLNVGCIPSKALLHAAKVISEVREAQTFGISFGKPEIDLDKLRGWKNKVLGQLTTGLKGLAKQRKVQVLYGQGQFISANCIRVKTAEGDKLVGFEQAIIAVGSQPVSVPGFPQDPRIIDSTGALKLDTIPPRLLVIGGGIIGLEMATVFHELGSRITVVEMLDTIISGADEDIVKPLLRRLQKQYENIYLDTRVTGITTMEDCLEVGFEGANAPATDTFDSVLVAVGRQPNGNTIGAETAGIQVDEKGFIPVDRQQRTNVEHIFAIGDVVGQPMLAHKAVHEGKVAAEVAAGHKSGFDARVIPAVAYTDPEIAWVGVTEAEAKKQGIKYGKGVFPWAASGRSLTLGRNEGITKLLFDEVSGQLIGAGIAGPNAGDLIAEATLAIEMGCDADDIGLTIHPHPTLSETIAFSAEAFSGTITDLYIPKK
jgi:dihydrolipoamide dehydrogenase